VQQCDLPIYSKVFTTIKGSGNYETPRRTTTGAVVLGRATWLTVRYLLTSQKKIIIISEHKTCRRTIKLVEKCQGSVIRGKLKPLDYVERE